MTRSAAADRTRAAPPHCKLRRLRVAASPASPSPRLPRADRLISNSVLVRTSAAVCLRTDAFGCWCVKPDFPVRAPLRRLFRRRYECTFLDCVRQPRVNHASDTLRYANCTSVAMVYCCVPLCKSQQGKTPGVSYHQFPSDEELCSKWKKNVSRENLVINDKSASTVVCSKHFTENDLVPGYRIRKLRPGVVPTVFDQYPSYMVPATKRPRKEPAARGP